MKQLPSLCSVIVLALSATACVSVPQAEEQLSSLDLSAGSYVVRAGDTLESIAFRYKLSPNELAALNPGAGRYFAPGTHLVVHSASNSSESYRRESAWVTEPSGVGSRNNRQDQAVTTPVQTPRAVPEQARPSYGESYGQSYAQQAYAEPGADQYADPSRNSNTQYRGQGYDQNPGRSVLTPAVSAVVSDVTLLDSSRPYRETPTESTNKGYARQSQPQSQSGYGAYAQPGSQFGSQSGPDIAYQRQNGAVSDYGQAGGQAQYGQQQAGTAYAPAPNGQSPGQADSWQSARAGQSSQDANSAYVRQNDRDSSSSYARENTRDTESEYGQQEVVEEEYNAGSDRLSSRDVSEQLQPLVGKWGWPTQGQVARGFAPLSEGRHGVDIAGVPGQPVVAVKDGVVAYSGKDPSGSGNLIIVRHDNAMLTAYSHTKDLYVAEDDTVKAGDPIGTLGWNARQESVLRFEVRQDGNSLNPMDFLSVQ